MCVKKDGAPPEWGGRHLFFSARVGFILGVGLWGGGPPTSKRGVLGGDSPPSFILVFFLGVLVFVLGGSLTTFLQAGHRAWELFVNRIIL